MHIYFKVTVTLNMTSLINLSINRFRRFVRVMKEEMKLDKIKMKMAYSIFKFGNRSPRPNKPSSNALREKFGPFQQTEQRKIHILYPSDTIQMFPIYWILTENPYRVLYLLSASKLLQGKYIKIEQHNRFNKLSKIDMKM